MPSKLHQRRACGTFGLRTLSAAVVSALVFSSASAAGLGKLTVLSPLGQPLRAEIEITSVSQDEVGNLVAKLASPEAFRQANIDYGSMLGSLRFAVEQRGDRQVIRVSSTQPLNEPFVDMLLELSGPNGRLVREYTFLLDPPDLKTQSAQVAPTPVPAPPQNARSATNPGASVAADPSRRTGRAESTASSAERPAGASEPYRVRKGDTLGGIAGQIKPNGISLDQMLVALYRNNPDAFSGSNMNRLRAGQILNVPDAEAARSVRADEARRIVVAQAADFQAYRSKLAGQAAESSAQGAAGTRQAAGGRISAQVDERATPASEAKDKLQLSNAAPSGSAASAEDLIAKEKALAEANARVKELERNVSELQKLLEIKNRSLAEQQKQASAASVTESTEAGAPAATTGQPSASSPAQAGVDKPAVENTRPEQPVATPANTQPAATPQAKPPVAEESFVDSLLDNPLVLPGLGALLVALGGLGIYRARRQKQVKQFEDSLITDTNLKANSLFGSTGGQSVDTSNSVFNSSFSPSASQLDSNEVDPVAEADVYIAYGRDAQAEEILKEALRTQPERHAVRVKLLEIYSNRKDLRAFEVLATELYGMTNGEGDEWAQAAAMGAAIDPTNPLYGNGNGKQELAAMGAATAVMAAPTQPLDEQGLATLLANTQADIGEHDAETPLDADTAYFSNTQPPVAASALEPESESRADADVLANASTNDLDFELDEIDADAVQVPNTIPRPVPTAPPAAIASIDFDFLDEPVAQQEPAAEARPPARVEAISQMDVDLPELPKVAGQDGALSEAPLQLDDVQFSGIDDKAFFLSDNGAPAEPEPASIPELTSTQPESAPLAMDFGAPEETPASQARQETAGNPLDFDLSGISLELDPLDDRQGDAADFGLADIAPLGDASSSAIAEMATKLDLAIAYQEIGDKEGARELLDEVVKGGTPEQCERARSLLLELA